MVSSAAGLIVGICAFVLDHRDIKKGKIIANPKKSMALLAIKFSFETESTINDAEYLWDFEDGLDINIRQNLLIMKIMVQTMCKLMKKYLHNR